MPLVSSPARHQSHLTWHLLLHILYEAFGNDCLLLVETLEYSNGAVTDDDRRW